MKCPNCNAEIPEGKMYCEKCGCELQIVSEYDIDIDIENEMNNTLSNIAENEFDDFDDDYDDDDDIDFDDDPNVLSFLLSGKAGGKFFYIFLILILIGLGIFAVYFGKRISEQKTLEYQIEMAEENIKENNYLKAISYYEEAYKLDNNPQYLFKIADFYYALERENDAIFTLLDIANGDFPEIQREEAYNKVFTLYENSGNYSKITELLENCTVESVYKNYSEYAVVKPEFNYEAGTYSEAIIVKLSSSVKGVIHYTTDGSKPDANSPIYESPIYLDYGSYNINAVYENKYGMLSEVVNNKYLIDVAFVFEPSVSTESGNYYESTLIEADVPVMYNLFYTTDGTDPDRNSTKYTGPIQMPLGRTVYKFVAYAADGTQSTIIEREYNLEFDGGIDGDSAVNSVKMRLMEKGINLDMEGHRPGVDGNYLYVFATAYPVIGNGDALFVVEYFVNSYGNTKPSGTVFGVNVHNIDDVYIVQPKGAEYMRVEF